MHMPRLSGLETIRRIRERRLILPCILLSGGVDDGLREQARGLQAFSVLLKPVRFSELTGVVCQALRVTYGWQPETSTGARSDVRFIAKTNTARAVGADDMSEHEPPETAQTPAKTSHRPVHGDAQNPTAPSRQRRRL